jgi:hypothetical protein
MTHGASRSIGSLRTASISGAWPSSIRGIYEEN